MPAAALPYSVSIAGQAPDLIAARPAPRQKGAEPMIRFNAGWA
jgi:hypothetical protein